MSKRITITAILDYGRPTSNAQKLGSIIHDLYEKKKVFHKNETTGVTLYIK